MIESILEGTESLLTWLVSQVETWGYVGIFSMMFLESTFFPFPSEVAMIPAGYLASKGRMDASLAILAGLLGSLLGAYFNYYLAKILGVPVLRRYGRYIFFNEQRLNYCTNLFLKHGEITTFVCRLIPVVRQYISLPAGISGMPRFRFGLYTGLGAGIWVAILTIFGYGLGKTITEVETNPDWKFFKEHWQDHKTSIFLGVGLSLLVILGIYFYFKLRLQKLDTEEEDD